MCLFFCQWEGDGSLIATFLKKLILYAYTPISITCKEESSMKSNSFSKKKKKYEK